MHYLLYINDPLQFFGQKMKHGPIMPNVKMVFRQCGPGNVRTIPLHLLSRLTQPFPGNINGRLGNIQYAEVVGLQAAVLVTGLKYNPPGIQQETSPDIQVARALQ